MPRGPSQIPSDFEHLTYRKEMDRDDIREVQQLYVDAAKRARTAGFLDIVYVYGSHSYLPQQFLTPYYNKWTDEYGGSFENRARFWRETIEQDWRGSRGRLRDLRPHVDRHVHGRARHSTRARLRAPPVEMCDDIVDAPDINVSGISGGRRTRRRRASTSGRLLPGRSGSRRKKPVLGVGRPTSPDLMVEAIESGALDIIATCRLSISDPFLPKKIDEGRLEDIRECIGCNICISRWGRSAPAAHLHSERNRRRGVPARLAPEKFSQAENLDNDVLVVGSGPAGMEWRHGARQARMRRVHPRRGTGRHGRDHALDPAAPGLGEWARVVNYRAHPDRQARTSSSSRTPSSTQTASRTTAPRSSSSRRGGYWATNGLNGCTHDTIEGADASQPLVPDSGADHARKQGGRRAGWSWSTTTAIMGPSIAEKLATDGHQVTLMTHLGHIGPYMHFTLEAPNMHRKPTSSRSRWSRTRSRPPWSRAS